MAASSRVVRVIVQDGDRMQQADAVALARDVMRVAGDVSWDNLWAIRVHQVAPERSYLRLTGALPLRFRPGAGWPPPLPPSETAGTDSISSTANAGPASSETPAADAAPAPATAVAAVEAAPGAEPAVTSAPAATTTAAPTNTRPPENTRPMPTALTADMVLGLLDGLPSDGGRAAVRFEPAIPASSATP